MRKRCSGAHACRQKTLCHRSSPEPLQRCAPRSSRARAYAPCAESSEPRCAFYARSRAQRARLRVRRLSRRRRPRQSSGGCVVVDTRINKGDRRDGEKSRSRYDAADDDGNKQSTGDCERANKLAECVDCCGRCIRATNCTSPLVARLQQRRQRQRARRLSGARVCELVATSCRSPARARASRASGVRRF